METVLVASDGGYLVAGTTLSAGNAQGDVWLVKVNEDGTVAWQKAYGGAGADVGYDVVETSDGGFGVAGVEQARSVDETSDGGFVVAGVTMSSLADQEDLWLMMTDADGFMGSSCAVVQDLTVSSEATAVEPVPTAATVSATAITARSTSAKVVETDIGSLFDCSE